MSYYVQKNGVHRGIQTYLCKSNVQRACWRGYVRENGTSRQWMDILDMIDHVEITDFTVDDRAGTASIGSDSISIAYGTSEGAQLRAYGYVVLKNGSKIRISVLTANTAITSFQLNVTGTLSWSGNGNLYCIYVFGTDIFDGSLSGTYFSKTVAISPDSARLILEAKGSSSRTTVTFNSCTINGKNYPITIVNDL